MDEKKCGTCAFWEKEDSTFGACHAHPPGVRLGFPSVLPSSWCGEWRAVEKPIQVIKKK